MKFKAILFHIFSIFIMTEAHAQYTYPVYGGVFRTIGYSDSVSGKLISVLSSSNQKIRVTNYYDYDTTLSLTSNKVADFLVLRKYFCLGVRSNNSIAKRCIFVLANDPLTVSFVDIFQRSQSVKV